MDKTIQKPPFCNNFEIPYPQIPNFSYIIQSVSANFYLKFRQRDNASTLEWEYCGKAVSKFHVSSARPVNLTRHSIFKSKRSREVMLSHAYGLPSWTGKC